nr:hypothetical protein [Tanacetum cinerariifolium]
MWGATTATRGDILLGSAKLQENKKTRTRKAQEGVEEWPNYALVAFSSSYFDSKVSNDSTCLKSCLETVKILKSQNEQLLKDLKKFELMVLEDIKVLKVEIQMNEIAIGELRKKLEIAQKEKDDIQLNLEKFENASKSLNKLIECQIVDNCKKELGYENYNAVPPPYTGNFMPLTPDLYFTSLDEFVNKPVVKNVNAKSSEEEGKVDCNYHQKQFQNQRMVKHVWNNAQRVNHKNFAKKIHPYAKKNIVSRSVIMKSGLVSVNTARQVNAAHSKTTMNVAISMSYLSKTAHSTTKRSIHKNTTIKNNSINKRVNTIRPKAVVNVVKENNLNAVKALACWVWKPKNKVLYHVSKHNSASITLKKFDYVDSQGISKEHVLSYDYKEIDGGYVAFGGNPKGRKITGKWTIKTGHLNFKTMNNLVKGNLVRGLPSNLLKMIKPVLLVKRESSTELLAKTINEEVQLHAKVDGKKIMVTKSSVRRDLRLAGEEGIVCLLNSTIFEQLALMGKPKRKNTQVPQPSGPTKSVADEAVHKELREKLVKAVTTTSNLKAKKDNGNINKSQSKATPNESSFQGTNLGGGPRCQKTMGILLLKLGGEEVFVAKQEVVKDVNENFVKEVVNAAQDSTTTTTITIEEITLAQALKDLKTLKPKVKGIDIHEQEESGKSTTKTSTISKQQSQDKGKGIMIEEPVKSKKKDQIRLDEEAVKRKGYIMCTTFGEKKKALYSKKSRREKEQTTNRSSKEKDNIWVNTFKDFRTELVKGKEKRAGEELIQESKKKQKVEDDKETAELKELIEIIPDKEEVVIDAIPLVVKSPRIVDWKIHKEGKKSYYQILRANGKSQMYMVFSKMLESFDREDLEDLYKIKSLLDAVGVTATYVCVNTA